MTPSLPKPVDSEAIDGQNDAGLPTASGSVTVVVGRDLQATQVAREQDVIYREVPHHPLSEAEFYCIVDPPPRSHQWLPTVRGAFLTSLLIAVTPLIAAASHSDQVAWSLVPDPAKAGLALSTALWIVIGLKVRFGPDRRRDTIARIRKTWN